MKETLIEIGTFIFGILLFLLFLFMRILWVGVSFAFALGCLWIVWQFLSWIF